MPANASIIPGIEKVSVPGLVNVPHMQKRMQTDIVEGSCKVIRIGLVGFDTSHVVQFTMRLNQVGIEEEQWVEGAKIVAGFPGTSKITDEDTVAEYTETVVGYGVEPVDAPEELIGQVDAVMVEFQSGSVHLEYARPFLEAGLPVFVDKPFTCSVADARELAELAAENDVPVFSSSSLRYALEIQQLKAEQAQTGEILGAMAYSPASLHPENPGLFHYGIHAVETMYALMGQGCQEVWCTYEAGAEVVVGRWEDERIGSIRGTRAGTHGYGFTVWCENEMRGCQIDASVIYRELLKQIVGMFESGNAPLNIEESIEIVAFIEAAAKSAQFDGRSTSLFE